MKGDWYAIRFQLAAGYDHEDALDVLAGVERHKAVGTWSFGDVDAPAAEVADVVDERTRILEVARGALPATGYNALVRALAGWPVPPEGP